jgi:hypothetical protein
LKSSIADVRRILSIHGASADCAEMATKLKPSERK